VPTDLSVTGYDDTEIAAHTQPALTTVSSDVIAWGQAAARRLLEAIDGRAFSEATYRTTARGPGLDGTAASSALPSLAGRQPCRESSRALMTS